MIGRLTKRDLSESHNHGRSKLINKKNVKYYNCGEKWYAKKEWWANQKSRNSKVFEPSNARGCITNTFDDGEIPYSEAITVAKGKNQFVDVLLIDSRLT